MLDHEMPGYLASVHVTKLQSAARLAGLRWKSGTPGYDKAGIIERLRASPSIMRACVAQLKRMEAGEGFNQPRTSGNNPFASDIEDEISHAPPSEKTEVSAVSDALITGILRRIDFLEGYAISADTAETIAGQKDAPIAQALRQVTERLSARLDALETRRPIELALTPLKTVSIPSGAHESYAKLLEYLEINGRVILTGSAGTGKSMAVKNAADALGLEFHLQTPVTMDHQYLGHRDANGVFHETPTFKAYVYGGLLLWDEADAGLPDAMLAANPIFDGNGFATFGDGNMYPQHPNFRAVFNMNTDGNGATMQYAGRNRLDGATLARFGCRIHWGIDSRIEASMAAGQDTWHAACVAVREFMAKRNILDVNATPRHVKTGAALLNRGTQTRQTILCDVLKSGALSESWAEVENLPAVRTFLRG